MFDAEGEAAAAQLSLAWLGGPTERRLRMTRPSFDDLPWDSFDLATADDSDDPGFAEARAVWTNGVFTEYASGAAFNAMSLALMEAGAPVDLCAAAADFAVDEMVHVALVSRLVMTLGGAVPYVADLSKIAPVTRENKARLRAAELAIKISCVGEALSLPALSASHRGASHPLARAVLERLKHDEAPHAAIGHWFLEWADGWLSKGDRELLGTIASEAVAVYAPIWLRSSDTQTVIDRAGDVVTYRGYMEREVNERIVGRLAKAGIACTTPQPARE